MKTLIKNKKGTLFIGFLFAFFFFMLGVWLIPSMQDSVTSTRTSIGCTNSSISDGAKLTCLMADSGVPYFIVIILTLVGGFIGNEL